MMLLTYLFGTYFRGLNSYTIATYPIHAAKVKTFTLAWAQNSLTLTVNAY